MRWKTGRWLVLCALIGAGALAAGQLWRRGPSDDSVPKSQVFHFGERRVGETVEHTFAIRNSSPNLLRIEKIVSSCACTVIGEAPDVIARESVCHLPVRMTLEKAGQAVESVVMVFIEAAEPIQLRLTGTVVRQVPKVVSFGNVLRGEAATKEIYVKALSASPLSIRDVKYDARYFNIETSRSPANSRDGKVLVALRPDVPFGPFKGTLEITTDEETQPVKRVGLHGYVFRRLEVKPPKAMLGMIGSGDEKRAEIVVSSPYGEDVSVERVELSPEQWTRCDVFAQDPRSSAVKMSLCVTGGFPEKVLRGKLKVFAEVGEHREQIEVTFFAMGSDS